MSVQRPFSLAVGNACTFAAGYIVASNAEHLQLLISVAMLAWLGGFGLARAHDRRGIKMAPK